MALGSALGGLARLAVSTGLSKHVPAHLPVATLVVNIVGSFFMALAAGILVAKPGSISEASMAFLAPGFLGGFTTYSAFNQATIVLARDQGIGPATLHVAVTVGFCLAAGSLGFWAGQRVA